MNLLSSLRYLVALHEHQHFGRAAQACHITQPALSNALRALEREFGVVIVKRDRTFAGLTPEGKRVLASAQLMLHEHAVLQQELQSNVSVPRGGLRIAAVPTAVPIAARFAALYRVRYPGVVPEVLSMSSLEIERGLDELAIDLALGYTQRMGLHGAGTRLAAIPQYTEHYFLLRRRGGKPGTKGLHRGASVPWREAARLPLCMLSPEMHNRTIVDAAFTSVGLAVQPAMQTNSILTMALSVVAGDVCSVLPGALVGSFLGYGELEARPLAEPEVFTPIGFMSHSAARPSPALAAALTMAREDSWLQHAAAHSGSLTS